MENNQIKQLIGVKNPRVLLTKPWYKSFAAMSKSYQQFWFDRVLIWLSKNPDKHEILMCEEPIIREMLFSILAAGFYEKNKKIDMDGVVAVKCKNRNGEKATGYIVQSDDGQDGCIIVEEE